MPSPTAFRFAPPRHDNFSNHGMKCDRTEKLLNTMSADDFFDENNLEDGAGENFEEESTDCPICYDPLDVTDLCFKPCPCGFQVCRGILSESFSRFEILLFYFALNSSPSFSQTCRFCWNHINENMNGKCPGCRTPYNSDKYTFTQPDPARCAFRPFVNCRSLRSSSERPAILEFVLIEYILPNLGLLVPLKHLRPQRRRTNAGAMMSLRAVAFRIFV
jgi:hypothetical protein